MTAFNTETRIPHPVDTVFLAYRDELAKLASFINNVKNVEVLERKEEGGVVKLLNKWRASAEIPSALKAVVSEDKLSWLDHASWEEAGKVCRWTLEITAFKEAVSCKGETRFYPEGTGTRMTIAGELTVDASKVGIPVPKFMQGTIGKTVESFAVALIRPNQEAVGKAVGRYLDEKKQKG